MKRTTDTQTRRDDVLAELSALQPMADAVRKLSTAAGFIEYFLRLEPLYATRREAYEALEDRYAAIFGRFRYSVWRAFQVVLSRHRKKNRKNVNNVYGSKSNIDVHCRKLNDDAVAIRDNRETEESGSSPG